MNAAVQHSEWDARGSSDEGLQRCALAVAGPCPACNAELGRRARIVLALEDARPEQIVAELERRAINAEPVTARCPECTRTDALVAVQCAERHHPESGFPGLAYFPLESRRRALLALKMQDVLRAMRSQGVSRHELGRFLPPEDCGDLGVDYQGPPVPGEPVEPS